MSDVLDINKFPYTYDIIKPTLQSQIKAYVSLTKIPIPPESVEINIYIHHKDSELNKETDFAGSAFWFGINQKSISNV